MKNKIKIILIIMLFMLPFSVNAENEVEANMVLNCDKTSLSPGGTTTCTLKLNVDKGNVYALETYVVLTENLSLDGRITFADEFMSMSTNNEINVYPIEGQGNTMTGLMEIATFKVKASSNITYGVDEKISLTPAKVSILFGNPGDYQIDADNNGQPDDMLAINTVSSNVRIVSSVNTLSRLTLSNGTLSPSFSSNTTNYSATVDASKVTISVTKTDAKSTISGSTGEVNLNYGVNTFKINVTSESGSTKTYTITITRPDNRDKNNSLSNLSFNGDIIDLKSDVSEYSYEVENDVTQMRLEATLSSNKATFIENYGPRTVKLNEGENVIEIKIKAENETIKTYTLNIKRKAPAIEEDPGTGDNTGGGGNNSGNNNVPDSPPTGSLSLYIVLTIVVISIVGLVYYFNQYQKKQVNNSNDEK